MTELKEWIAGRDETVIAVVAHWGVWYSLTGREFENCELVVGRCGADELRYDPRLLKDAWFQTC